MDLPPHRRVQSMSEINMMYILERYAMHPQVEKQQKIA